MAAEAVDENRVVLRRIRRISAGAYFVFAIPVLISSGWHGFIGLTCSAVITMINFLWLEEIVNAVLQPSPRLRPWKLPLRALGRYALLGAALSVAIFVARFNALSVLLGFSIVVVGIMGEAAYSNYRALFVTPSVSEGPGGTGGSKDRVRTADPSRPLAKARGDMD